MPNEHVTTTGSETTAPPEPGWLPPDLGLTGAILDALPDHVCVLDERGIIRFTNASWRAFSTANGGRPEAMSEGVDYLAVCRRTGEGDGNDFGRQLAAVLEGRLESFTFEYPCHSPSEQRWFLAHVGRLAHAGRAMVLVRHEASSEGKLARASAGDRERSRALEEAVAGLSIGVSITEAGSDGIPRVVTANEAHDRIVGATTGEGTPLASLPYTVFKPDRETPIPVGDRAGCRAARSGQAVHDPEQHILRPDGTWRIVSSSAAPIPAGKPDAPARSLTVLLDLTDQFEAQADVRSSEAFLRTVLETAIDAFWLVDPQGRLLDVNPAYCAMSGYTREELLTMRVPDLDANETPAETTARIRAIEQAGGGRFESRHRHKSGHLFDVEVSVTYLGGGHQLMVCFLRDVTARRQAEEDILRAKTAAEQASRAKSAFLASMSHEIRTPLNGVIGMQQLLLRTPLSSQQQEYVNTANGSAQTLLHLISDVLDLSRIEARQLQLDPQPFSLRATVDRIAGPVALAATQKGIGFSVEISPGTPDLLVGDSWRLGQVLNNFLSNAVKFTERGDVALHVEGALLPDGAADVTLAVRDTGIGIDPAAMPRLFEPFTQADGSISRRFGGTGLGLSISKQIVDMMGGSIGVESRPGHGSTFRVSVRLPTSREAVAPPPELQGPETGPSTVPAPARPRHILLAEDNPVNQLLATRLLQLGGHTVTVAANGRQALQFLAKERFDLVLMDVQMPEMDGLEALRRLRFREQATGTHLHVIAVTAQALSGDRENCLAAGADDYLAKPFAAVALELAVARAPLPDADRIELPGPVDLRARFKRCADCAAFDAEDCESRQSGSPLHLAKALEACGGDEAIRSEVTQGQLRSLPADREAIRAASSTGDWRSVARLAHRLKSSLATTGAILASEAAHDLEQAARSGDPLAGRLALRCLCEVDRAIPALESSLSVGSE